LPRENDLEGRPDMGGKHGGQAGQPKSPPRPQTDAGDEDVARKQRSNPSSDKDAFEGKD
jgi:hypothetical protein